jgi:t-SNARE complex subunit (syntaxin)
MSSNEDFDEIAARLEAESRAKRQKLIAEVKANRLDIEAAILRENEGDPKEAQKLLEMFNKSLNELE